MKKVILVVLIISSCLIALYLMYRRGTAVNRLDILFDKKSCYLRIPQGVEVKSLYLERNKNDKTYELNTIGDVYLCSIADIAEGRRDFVLYIEVELYGAPGTYRIVFPTKGEWQILKAENVLML